MLLVTTLAVVKLCRTEYESRLSNNNIAFDPVFSVRQSKHLIQKIISEAIIYFHSWL